MVTYRASRLHFWLWLAMLAFFVTALGVTVDYGFADAPPDSKPWLLGMAVVTWGGMSCLSSWLLLVSIRHRLEWNDIVVRDVGALKTRELRLADIVEARWRIVPIGGSLRLKTRERTITIEFGSYDRTAQLEIASHFRAALPLEVQHDWEMFCYKILLRIRRQQSAVPEDGVVVIPRRRWDWYFLAALPPVVAVSWYSWRMTGEVRYLYAPVATIPFWLLMRFATPRDGMVVHNEVKSPLMKRYWRNCLASIAGVISLFILLCSLEVVSSSMLVWSMLAAMVLTLPFFIWSLYCIERERLRLELPLAQAAAARWQSMTTTVRGRPTAGLPGDNAPTTD